MGAMVASENADGQNIITVDGDKCIACGACFDACEHGAREYVDDTEAFFAALKKGERISILIAPAFLANYPREYESVLGGLKKLGVNHMISVSFGADITTWGYLNYVKKYNFVGGISQPCPAVVSYIEKYVPELLPKLFPVQSPMMCAAVYARKTMGITDKLAFISPCIAKKDEITSKRGKGYISYNVTFNHLMEYARKHNVTGPSCKDEIEYGLGSVYPMPGGLKENVYWFLGEDAYIRQCEGESHMYHYLEANKERLAKGGTPYLFVDALNCAQGCIYGQERKAPRTQRMTSSWRL
jgi:iron only hydrogenase large subunit-like protein